MQRRGIRLLIAVAALFVLGVVQSASAESTAAIDAGTAAGLCSAVYPPAAGTEPLSPCQWDMGVIHADAAHGTATGAGVKVGVIDGGVDFTHPDLAGAIDVARPAGDPRARHATRSSVGSWWSRRQATTRRTIAIR